MDTVIIASYREMVSKHECSAEDLLHDPMLRVEFLALCSATFGTTRTEKQILSRLSNLRKQSKLPRSRELAKNSRNPV